MLKVDASAHIAAGMLSHAVAGAVLDASTDGEDGGPGLHSWPSYADTVSSAGDGTLNAVWGGPQWQPAEGPQHQRHSQPQQPQQLRMRRERPFERGPPFLAARVAAESFGVADGTPVFKSVEEAPSRGSMLHGTGDCKPCAWFWKANSCQNGWDCLHCHACPKGELKIRRKCKLMSLRQEGVFDTTPAPQRRTQDGAARPMSAMMAGSPSSPGGTASTAATPVASANGRPLPEDGASEPLSRVWASSASASTAATPIVPERQPTVEEPRFVAYNEETYKDRRPFDDASPRSQGLPLTSFPVQHLLPQDRRPLDQGTPRSPALPLQRFTVKQLLSEAEFYDDGLGPFGGMGSPRVGVRSRTRGASDPASTTSTKDPALPAKVMLPSAAEPGISSAELQSFCGTPWGGSPGCSPVARARSGNLVTAPAPPPGLPMVNLVAISQGSVLHGTGECRPCAWLYKASGCRNGASCQHCHVCPPGELKIRRRAKVAMLRGGENEKDEAVTSAEQPAATEEQCSTTCSDSEKVDDEALSATRPAPVLESLQKVRVKNTFIDLRDEVDDIAEKGSTSCPLSYWRKRGSGDSDTGLKEPPSPKKVAVKDSLMASFNLKLPNFARRLPSFEEHEPDSDRSPIDMKLYQSASSSVPAPGLETFQKQPDGPMTAQPGDDEDGAQQVPFDALAAPAPPMPPPADAVGVPTFDPDIMLTGPPPPGDPSYSAGFELHGTPGYSQGSALHGTGKCRPCRWFWKPEGCKNGTDCHHCHACPPWEVKIRKKTKAAHLRS